MDKLKEIAKGKAKSMFTTSNPNELIMEFRDDASAFDGKKMASLAGKGSVNNQFNAFIMNYLGDNGVEHHLINLIDNTHSLVHSLDMFPIECVIRNRATGGAALSNKDFKDKNLIIFFYPKDNTPGCTLEGQDFRDNYKEFSKLNAEILGVSRDSLKSHENFKEKQDFPFQLLSDPDEKMCISFDVMREKSMYGKKYIGVDRSTFLINTKGIIVKEWRSVKVKGHVNEVLEALRGL